MQKTEEVITILPHDPAVKTFPFSKIPLSTNFERIYSKLHTGNILGKLEPRVSGPDVPQFYIYACARTSGGTRVNVSYGFGGSDDEQTAAEHAIAEAIEHYCILHENKRIFIHGTYNELKTRALDPLELVPFTKQQLSTTKFKKFTITHNTSINWLTGHSLYENREILIPASLAYVNYSSKKHIEPMIRMPISTGAACGPNIDFAIYRGLCEIIERDGYMISFLPEMPKKLIKIDSSEPELNKFLRKFDRYGFELYFIDTTLDSGVFSVVCLLVDRTGVGSAVCAGLGGGLDTHQAIKTSAIEAIRRYVSNQNSFFRSNSTKLPKKYSFDWFVKQKQQTWAAPHMIKKVEDIVKNAKRVKLQNPKEFKNDKDCVKYLITRLNDINCKAFYIDMTIPEVERLGLKVVKVLIPKMVPLWHDERYPYLGMKRLAEIPKEFGIIPNLDLKTTELLEIHPF